MAVKFLTRLTLAALVFSLALAGCGASEEPDSELAPTTDWQVVATQTGDRSIAAIKAIRKVTDLGLKAAKDLADSPQASLCLGFPRTMQRLLQTSSALPG